MVRLWLAFVQSIHYDILVWVKVCQFHDKIHAVSETQESFGGAVLSSALEYRGDTIQYRAFSIADDTVIVCRTILRSLALGSEGSSSLVLYE